MRKETWGAFLVAMLFAAVAFIGTNVGLADFGSESLAVSGSASVFGMIIGMAVFFSLFAGLDRAGDSYDVQQKFSKLRIEATSKTRLERVRGVAGLRAEIAGSSSGAVDGLSRWARMVLRVRDTDVPGIRQRLLAAGFYSDVAALYYLILKALLPFTLPVLALFAMSLLHVESGRLEVVVLLLCALSGFYLPDLWLRVLSKRRRERVMLEAPDLLDLVCIYAEAGMSFDSALPRAVQALKTRIPSAASEFSILERELRMLPDRRKAFRNLAMRVDTPLMKNFVSIMDQSESIGTPIAEALRRLGEEGRRYRMALAEQKAARIPVVINIPVVLFILPTLLAVILGPTAIKIYQILMVKHI